MFLCTAGPNPWVLPQNSHERRHRGYVCEVAVHLSALLPLQRIGWERGNEGALDESETADQQGIQHAALRFTDGN